MKNRFIYKSLYQNQYGSKMRVMILMKLYMKTQKKIYLRWLTVSWIPNDAGINYQDCCKKNVDQLGNYIDFKI